VEVTVPLSFGGRIRCPAAASDAATGARRRRWGSRRAAARRTSWRWRRRPRASRTCPSPCRRAPARAACARTPRTPSWRWVRGGRGVAPDRHMRLSVSVRMCVYACQRSRVGSATAGTLGVSVYRVLLLRAAGAFTQAHITGNCRVTSVQPQAPTWALCWLRLECNLIVVRHSPASRGGRQLRGMPGRSRGPHGQLLLCGHWRGGARRAGRGALRGRRQLVHVRGAGVHMPLVWG
jgi:hypothetical protein